MCHLPENAVIYIDNIIVDEYDQQGNYVGKAYECYFDQNGYLWSSWNNSGDSSASVVSGGYDEIGGSLCITSNQENTECATKQTADSVNGFFKINPNRLYKVSFRVNSSVALPQNDIRVQIDGYSTTFTGRLNDFALYQAEI